MKEGGGNESESASNRNRKHTAAQRGRTEKKGKIGMKGEKRENREERERE